MDFLKYNSTNQFSAVVKAVKSTADHHGRAAPTIRFEGTVKAHGTNAAVVFGGPDLQEFHVQSRERILTATSDNAGFAQFIYGCPEALTSLREVARSCWDGANPVAVFGEWVGSGVQKGAGVGKLKEKMLLVFAVNAGSSEFPKFMRYPQPKGCDRVRDIREFGVYTADVDFANPELSRNEFVRLTTEVEARCPIAAAYLPEDQNLVGEGIVWRAQQVVSGDPVELDTLVFKVKGEKHSASKVKVLASVDVEKVKCATDFVDYACTPNRLEQGLAYMREMGIEFSPKSTGDYVRWVLGDIVKEELETLTSSGLEVKDVSSTIASRSRLHWLSRV